MRKKKYFWFVEPLDSQTNEAIRNQLEEDKFSRLKTSDGRTRPLWACDREFVQALWDSRENLGLRFRVYSALAGPNGSNRDIRIRECTFLFRKNGWHKKQRQRPKKIPVKTAASAAKIPF